jgi:hypothetical protein
MSFRFESLEIWHKAREYAGKVYTLTSKSPPPMKIMVCAHR